MMSRYLSPEEYITIVTETYGKSALKHLNCLAFAFGDTKPDRSELDYTLISRDPDGCRYPISCAFHYECTKRDIKVEQVREPQLGNRYFIVFGWFRSDPMQISDDFHIARLEPDGSIVHKLGWGLAPTTVDWETLREEYPERYELYRIIED